MTPDARRAGLSIDVTRDFRRRIRLATALRDPSIGGTGLELSKRLNDDSAEEKSADLPALRASTDPVLAELWDNPADARYDEL